MYFSPNRSSDSDTLRAARTHARAPRPPTGLQTWQVRKPQQGRRVHSLWARWRAALRPGSSFTPQRLQ